MEDCASEDERTIELSSIAAIFPELVIDPSDPYKANLDLPVTPLKPLRIQFSHPSADAAATPQLTPPPSVEQGQDEGKNVKVVRRNTEDQTEMHELEHLPSLKMSIELHGRYPAEEAPKVTLVTTPPWLSRAKLDELARECGRLWEEMGRDQVVYSYIDHLQQQSETAFGLTEDNKPVPMPSDIKLALLDYDLKTKRAEFEKGTFDCGVCLEPKKGKDCYRLLSCSHVFCTACLQDFYNDCITRGEVDNVKCLDPDCGKTTTADDERLRNRRKRDRTLNPSELLQIPIQQPLVQRYVALKRKARLESDRNTIYCPRQWCQGAARSQKHPKPIDVLDDFSESESEPEPEIQQPPPPAANKKKPAQPEDIPMAQRLAICEDCNFAFCIVCKKGWHGEITMCNPRRQKELDEEDMLSLQYMRHYSTPCPTCNAPAQKTMGCNHMICFKCRTHFCYLCSAWLNSGNPYAHYNDFKSGCYMRLWELEGGDGEGAGHNFHGGWEPEWDEEEENEEEQGPPEQVDQGAGDEAQAVEGRVGEVNHGDTDSEDEEPAPDIRPRERAIEFVNFARGNHAQRIVLPDEPVRAVVPPPAPVPPRPRGQRRRQGRQRNVHGGVVGMPPNQAHGLPQRLRGMAQRQLAGAVQPAGPVPAPAPPAVGAGGEIQNPPTTRIPTLNLACSLAPPRGKAMQIITTLPPRAQWD